MKIRSWSESRGAMLVPSTFTGWYRKTMMTRARPIAMSRSRVQTRISLRRLAACEAALGAGPADAFAAAEPAERRGAGFSGEVEAPRCFWSERSILGALLFIARASRRAPDGILPDARKKGRGGESCSFFLKIPGRATALHAEGTS